MLRSSCRSLALIVGLSLVAAQADADIAFQSAPELSYPEQSEPGLLPELPTAPEPSAEGRFLDDPSEPGDVILAQREEPAIGVSPYDQPSPLTNPQTNAPLYGGQPLYTPSSGQNSLLPIGTFGTFGPAVGFGGAYPGVSLSKRWLISVAQTTDYVTNLALPFTITPNNATVRQNDAQFQTNVFAQYLLAADEKQSLSTYFNYYQSLHPSAQQIDLWAYTAGARYARILTDRVTGLLDYNYTYYILNHQSLVSTNRVGPSLLVRGKCNSLWQMSYYYSDNNFRLDPNQTSTGHLAQIQRIKYLQNPGSYVFGGYAYGRNSAVLNSWSYDLNYAFGGYATLFGCCKRNQLFLFGSYGSYNFQGPDVIQTTTIRHDNIYTLQARVSRNITPHLSIFFNYLYYNSQSNVDRQTFQSNLYSFGAVTVF
jgi:hypothetical protein